MRVLTDPIITMPLPAEPKRVSRGEARNHRDESVGSTGIRFVGQSTHTVIPGPPQAEPGIQTASPTPHRRLDAGFARRRAPRNDGSASRNNEEDRREMP